MRGRFGSDGDFVPVEHEKADGAATVRWARAHEMSEKGRVCNRHVTDALQCTTMHSFQHDDGDILKVGTPRRH